MSRRIAVVTGTRAEFGLLRPLLRRLAARADCQLQLIVTGMHLSPGFGHTVDEIRAAGFAIAAEVPCLLDHDGDAGVAQSTGLGVVNMTTALDRLRPDCVVLLGDRFEIFAAAIAAYLLRLPIAHLHGGESTEGLVDEGVRHAISKLASLHFPCAEPYAARLRAMGEPAERVHCVGALGLDDLVERKSVDRAGLFADLGLDDRVPVAVATFHPVTLEPKVSMQQVEALCQALTAAELGTVIVTYPNADQEGRRLVPILERFVAAHTNAGLYVSLGRARYLAVLACADCMIGNSSSGLFEAPSYALPVVNIGARQQGRLRHANIVDCPPAADAITSAIASALDPAFRSGLADLVNRFGDGQATTRILDVLLNRPLPPLIKPFADGDAFAAAVAASGLRT